MQDSLAVDISLDMPAARTTSDKVPAPAEFEREKREACIHNLGRRIVRQPVLPRQAANAQTVGA
ncbi:hypothetical protein [Paracoccus mutanolyticus]|uniref:hypothetical protein n=1 Tax=Paracoccus mutanolyticus TaxID=1499308 RepID=UPI0011AEB77F|nr:hypothetical protein [Paracoccus mutanolyticus]